MASIPSKHRCACSNSAMFGKCKASAAEENNPKWKLGSHDSENNLHTETLMYHLLATAGNCQNLLKQNFKMAGSQHKFVKSLPMDKHVAKRNTGKALCNHAADAAILSRLKCTGLRCSKTGQHIPYIPVGDYTRALAHMYTCK